MFSLSTEYCKNHPITIDVCPLISVFFILSVTSREEHERSHRHPKTAVEKLSVPGEQSSTQRTTSPKPPDTHSRNRSRTPSSYHRVPENVTRSLSPPDLR